MRCCPACRRVWQEQNEFCAVDGTALLDMDPPRADPLVGVVLDGQFELRSMLGSGGMGIVYLAEQLDLGREVAVEHDANQRVGARRVHIQERGSVDGAKLVLLLPHATA
ncbi:MAG: hypothetical protein AAGF12_03610, partial [Myxococcota bacterium]